MRKTLFIITFLLVFTGGFLVRKPVTVSAEGSEITDTPTILVASDVGNFDHNEPKLFWHTGVPACPPALNGTNQPNVQYPETIKRIATYGSEIRTLYSEMRDCADGEILSNIVADDDYIYWLGPIGMMRLWREPSIAPECRSVAFDSRPTVEGAANAPLHTRNGSAPRRASGSPMSVR